MVVVFFVGIGLFSLTGCATTNQQDRIAKLEQQVQQDHQLLYDVVRRIGLGEMIRPESIAYDYAAIEGDVNAPVTIMEFTDLNCPYCAKFNTDTWPKLKKDYVDTGKLVLVAQDFPIVNLHPNAAFAALALRCAVNQKANYADVKQSLFEMKSLTTEQAHLLVEQYGLEQEKFDICVKDEKVQQIVRDSVKVGQDLGIKSTPTFLIGRNENGKLVDYEVITGAKDISFFIEKIESLLAK